jgi:hypothetical protein
MQLYSDALLNDLAGKKAVPDSLLSQMASGPSRHVLQHINTLFESVAAPVQDRWTESLRSTDNRRFFQGYGEAISAAFMARAGWRVVDICSPRPCLVLEHPDGRMLRIVTLAFLKTPPRIEDAEAKETLARVVNRADSDKRITILVHKWDPHTFDPEPVRRCVDIWLDAIKKGEWSGRFASYEDDHIKLEFRRTDEPTVNGDGAVSFLLAPPNGLHTMDVVESRLVYELDSLLGKAPKGTNIMLSLVTNTSWGLPPGLVRSLFYGRPTWTMADGTADNRRFGFQLGEEPALFQEDQYSGLSGVLVVDQPEDRGPCGRAYLNPWANITLQSGDVACAVFEQEHAEEANGYRVMRWA